VSFCDTAGEGQGGTSYVRWGRTTCGGNAVLIYKGIVDIFALTFISKLVNTFNRKIVGIQSCTVPVPGGVLLLPVLLIGKDFIRRSERSRLVPPNVPSFAELCRTTDDRLFNQILSNKAHVLNNLLSPTSVASQNYNLRQRRHHLELPNKTNHL